MGRSVSGYSRIYSVHLAECVNNFVFSMRIKKFKIERGLEPNNNKDYLQKRNKVKDSVSIQICRVIERVRK